MVSTGWRTACAVIVIIVGAALLTFAVFVYHRRKYYGRFPTRPEMRQRFMSSQTDDPEAHVSLLNASEMMPPIPPKTPVKSHGRSFSGGQPSFLLHDRGVSYGSADELGEPEPYHDKPRSVPTRVPVPPMFPEPEIHAEQPSYDGPIPIPMPKPSLPPSPSLLDRIQFPRIQFNAQGARKGRIPSLKISFVRESNQAISSPGDRYRPPPHIEVDGRPPSVSSGPSSLSRPFATMSTFPLPAIRPVSPLSLTNTNVSVHPQSPSTRAATPQDPAPYTNWDGSAPAPQMPEPTPPLPPEHEMERLSASSPTSITTAGLDNFSRNLFTRNPSTEGSSTSPSVAISRGSSYQTGRPMSVSDVARHSSLSSGSGSGVGSAPAQGLRRATTWVPNVLASYSPWHNVVPIPGSGTGGDAAAGSPSPTGQLRVPDGYRPMPTLEENPSEATSVSPITLPRSLPESTQGTYTGRSVSVREVRMAGGQLATVADEEHRPSMESVAESVAHVQAQAAEVLPGLPSPYDAREPPPPALPSPPAESSSRSS